MFSSFDYSTYLLGSHHKHPSFLKLYPIRIESCLWSFIIRDKILSVLSTVENVSSKDLLGLLFQTLSEKKGSLLRSTGISASPDCSQEHI